jgi:hypothetical protein
VNRVFVRTIFDDLHSFAAVRLLGAMLGYHEQLPDVILKKIAPIKTIVFVEKVGRVK